MFVQSSFVGTQLTFDCDLLDIKQSFNDFSAVIIKNILLIALHIYGQFVQ